MDQPGEGKQLLPQRQYNCFSTQPQPQPPQPSPWLWVPTCQISSYFIILLLVTITLLLVTGITATPLTPPALCRYARTP